jgi:nitrile hydratase alpha subunit
MNKHEHHDHKHEHHDHDHPHAPIEVPEGAGRHELMVHAIKDLLIENGVITGEEIRRALEFIDANTPAYGARIVARAWVDPAYKKRLLEDGTKAAAELGVGMGGAELIAVENSPEVHNVVVCTLCSCYPRTVLGLPPDWYKSRSYRARVVVEPRAVLKEFGTEMPEDVVMRVHDSNADMRYIVVPMRPEGTDGWPEERLAEIVTRDCMVGVALPHPSRKAAAGN